MPTAAIACGGPSIAACVSLRKFVKVSADVIHIQRKKARKIGVESLSLQCRRMTDAMTSDEEGKPSKALMTKALINQVQFRITELRNEYEFNLTRRGYLERELEEALAEEECDSSE